MKRSGTAVAAAKSKTRTRTRNKSQTTTSVTPTKENSEEGIVAPRKPPSNREREFKEKEPDSEGRKKEEKGVESVSKSKGSQAVQLSQHEQTKKVEVKNVDPDEEKMKRLLKKLKNAKKEPKAPQFPLDEKSKLLMDRVVKKPYPLKYVTKSKEELLMDEKSSFFKVTSSNSKRHQVGETDSYDNLPKMADIMKMKGQDIFLSDGCRPFWADYMIPLPNDMVGIEESVSVDQEHLERYNEGRITLKTCADKNPVTMNSFQPMRELRKRDELHFHDHLIFSNTVRSMVNVMSPLSTAMNDQMSGGSEIKKEAKTTGGAGTHKIRMAPKSPPEFIYLRSDPIRTARDVRLKGTNNKKTATATLTKDGDD